MALVSSEHDAKAWERAAGTPSTLQQLSSVTSLATRLGDEPREHGVQALCHRLHTCAASEGVVSRQHSVAA